MEAIIGLPDQLFYNTGISTYIWILTNRKRPERRGKIQLVNAVSYFVKRRKSLGNKRNDISPEQISEIVRIYGDFQETKQSKIFDNEDFGYRQITVERPLRVRYQATDEGLELFLGSKFVLALTVGDGRVREGLAAAFWRAGAASTVDKRVVGKSIAGALAGLDGTGPKIAKEMLRALTVRDEAARIVAGKKGSEPDPDLRDTEDVPLKEDIAAYVEREVLPYVPDAWVDQERTKIGYEIPFTRHFYEYVAPRPLEEIDAEIMRLEAEIQGLLHQVAK
ncbi:MAG: N-6 DNA methylase [Fimbriimonadales bacterium]